MNGINWADYDSKAYDDLHDDASHDDRAGDHILLVSEIEEGTWPAKDGYPERGYVRVKGQLTTARNATQDITFNAPVPEAEVEAQRKTWDRAKQQGVDSGRTLYKHLIAFYGVNPSQVKMGDEIGVKNVKTKKGFIRTIALLPKDKVKALKEAKPIDPNEPPF